MARRLPADFDPDKWTEKFIKRALNQMWQWWPLRKHFKDIHCGPDGLYPCFDCEGRFSRDNVQVDHIEPYEPVDGSRPTPAERITRKLVWQTNMQLLCRVCHTKKSQKENAERRKNRGPIQRNRKKVPRKKRTKSK